MRPNIFISSTIVDLKYLRDSLRDAVEELCYIPVMSEHGEIGYIQPTTAADSCLKTVKQCQLLVLIVGTRYGHICNDGKSVTQREYEAAQEAEIPTITFVEPQVLNFKQVFDSDPKADLWKNFKAMDAPQKTFSFLDQINSSKYYNAMLPFQSAADAKLKLKLQLLPLAFLTSVRTLVPLGS